MPVCLGGRRLVVAGPRRRHSRVPASHRGARLISDLMIPKSLRAVALLAVILSGAACSDGVTPAPPPSLSILPDSRSIRVGETFQILANLVDASGKLDASSIVWQALDGTIASVSGSGTVTGLLPGDTRIVASVPGAADTMSVEVVQTAAEIVIDSIPEIRTGDVVQLSGRVIDTEGEEMDIPITWRGEPRTLVEVEPDGWLHALGAGPILITATAQLSTASKQATIIPAPPPPGCEVATVSLAVGETVAYDGGSALNLCLAGNARYTLIAANAGAIPSRLELRGAGLAPVAAGITPNLSPLRTGLRPGPLVPQPDRSFESRLRRQEREQLSFAAARRPALGPSLSISPSASAVGDLIDLSTATTCEEPGTATGRVEFIGERSIVVADTANPDGMTRAAYERFGVLFDTLLYPVVTEHFGEPAGLSGEDLITIFFTRAVNELTEADSRGYVGGYFWGGDLFPRASCASSNEREMFYMLAADPQGTINGNERSVEFVEGVSASTIAHELQHLINTSRRIFVNNVNEPETSWLNEGLSHIAEEAVYYRQAGRSPRQGIDINDVRSTEQQVNAANGYAVPNLLRLDSYLRDVERQGPFQPDDDLETRGAIWQFLRYALDRHSGDDRTVLRALVDANASGLPNLRAAFGMEPTDWFVDDVVAVYADNAVQGLAPRHRHPSWNFRSLLGFLNGAEGFVVEHRTLADGQVLSVGLEDWGAGYVRMRVGPGQVGSVRVGTAETPPPANVRTVILRTQ